MMAFLEREPIDSIYASSYSEATNFGSYSSTT